MKDSLIVQSATSGSLWEDGKPSLVFPELCVRRGEFAAARRQRRHRVTFAVRRPGNYKRPVEFEFPGSV